MNIVIYAEQTVDSQKGGIERMSVVLADMLFRLGHQIYFICKRLRVYTLHNSKKSSNS